MTVTLTSFKAKFFRDFPYLPVGHADPNDLNYVLDEDIQKALDEANVTINESIYPSSDAYTEAYLYLAAHYLVEDIKMGNEGLNSAGEGVLTSKSVGSMSESYSIPEKFLKHPFLAQFTKTKYGLKYLQITSLYAVGNVGTAEGATTS